jgi:septal ring factor EnvC (AmiA/AmiB activator)
LEELILNSKISKINAELAKTKQKISALQDYLQELEQQKTELENTNIVGLVREAGMTSQELAALLQTFRGKSEIPFPSSKQEDTGNEN